MPQSDNSDNGCRHIFCIQVFIWKKIVCGRWGDGGPTLTNTHTKYCIVSIKVQIHEMFFR